MIAKFLLISLLLVVTFSDTAIVTYHLYKSTDALTTVSCSDGANGIMSWGYRNISALFPYVTAWQSVVWNSPQCGSCVKLTYGGKFVYVTVIDHCEMINPAYSHFDMSKQAFTALFGQTGIYKGTMTANFTLVSPKLCQGNRKPVGLIPSIHLQSPQTVQGQNEQQFGQMNFDAKEFGNSNNYIEQNQYSQIRQQNNQDIQQNDQSDFYPSPPPNY